MKNYQLFKKNTASLWFLNVPVYLYVYIDWYLLLSIQTFSGDKHLM